MLQEFLSRNRETLLARCRSKVATRRAPRATEDELSYGIPLFLEELVNALRLERSPRHGLRVHHRSSPGGPAILVRGRMRANQTEFPSLDNAMCAFCGKIVLRAEVREGEKLFHLDGYRLHCMHRAPHRDQDPFALTPDPGPS